MRARQPGIRTVLALAVVCATLGCATSQTTGGVVLGQRPIRRGKIVLLPVADGKERGGDIAHGSGQAMTAGLRDRLVSMGIAPYVTEARSLVEAVAEAKALGYDYVLRGSIVAWEDNATEWSGNPDVAALSVELFDLTPVLVATATHRKKASAFAATARTPDRFISELVEITLGQVFGNE